MAKPGPDDSIKTESASPTERRQHRGWNTTWPMQRMDRYNVSGWSAAWCRCKPPPASASHPWQVCVCEPWRTHPTLTPLRQLSVAHSNAATGIQRWAKLTHLIRHNSAKGWNVRWWSWGYLPLKTMAAEAPITPKKGEYSGLSSEDILALFSEWCVYGSDCTLLIGAFPTLQLGTG